MTKTQKNDVENAKSQMRKGILEFCILQILAGEEMYSSEILLELKKAELIVVEGTVYPLLNRLKRAELLEYNWRESTNGPPRKYYAITPKGREMLDELAEQWDILRSAIDYLQ